MVSIQKFRFWRGKQICHDKKCIFVHVPKTAGTSIERILFSDKDIIGGHTTIQEYKEKLDKEIFSSYFKFGFARHPLDRLISAFFYIKKRSIGNPNLYDIEPPYLDNFNFFCRNLEHLSQTIPVLLPQNYFLCDLYGNIMVDFVGRFENLPSDFQHVCKQIGVSYTLVHANKSIHESYCKYYDKQTIYIVNTIYRKDFDIFGYDLGPIV